MSPFFSKGVNCERNRDTAGVLELSWYVKAEFFFSCKLCYRNFDVTEKAIQMMYTVSVND